MKKRVDRSRLKLVVISVLATLFVFFIFIPILFALLSDTQTGNIALIPIEGVISGGNDGFGSSAVFSQDIVSFIEEADQSPQIEVILLDINSPGGSAVASDEIATAVVKAEKPVVAVIHEAGASGAYWIASAADHVVANRMSITGSIGVLSSYLEFSGLMEKYGVGYEQLTAGERKEIGTPYKRLTPEERNILQQKLDKIHAFFIEEVAANRKMEVTEVKKIATGEFFLGVEALQLGLVDQLGGKDEAEMFMRNNYGLEDIDYSTYQHQAGFFELLTGVVSTFFFNVGEGIGSMFTKQQFGVWM